MDIETQQRGTPIFQRGTQADPAFSNQKQEPKEPISEPIKEEPTQQKPAEKDVEISVEPKAKDSKETQETIEETPKATEKEAVSEDRDSISIDPIEISFDEKETKQPTTDTAKETETVITEEMVKDFLVSKGIKVESLEELTRKEPLSEQVQKFKDFEEQTGRGIQDFLNAQKDWSKESQENTLREFLKYDQPNYSDEDIEEQVKLWTVTEEDEDELSAKELSEKRLESKRQYNKALDFMQKKAKEFATPSKQAAQPQTEEDIAKAYQPYWNKRDKSIDSFNEVKMKLGDKEVSLAITQEDKALLSRLTQSQESIFEPYILDNVKEGDVRINTDSLVFNQAWTIPQIRNRFISEIAKQVQSITLDKFSKENRNVTLDGNKGAAPTPETKSGLTVVSRSTQGSRRIGQPII